MSERKNKLDEINSRLDIAEEKISDFEDIAIEIIQTQTAKNKIKKEWNQKESVGCGTTSKDAVYI